MAQINRNALVMYSCQKIFDLVNDIERYPEFLPNCSNAQREIQDAQHVLGTVEIKKGPVCKTFTTKNTLKAPHHIAIELANGPFKTLGGEWLFTELDENACKVELILEYEFSSRLIEAAFGGVFKEVANNLVAAFTQRAKAIYGPPEL